MRPPTLIFSIIVHGGAISALAAVGAYASYEARRPARVEIQTSVASDPAAAQVPTDSQTAPDVQPESSPLPVDLPEDPIVPERELHRDVLEAIEPRLEPLLRVSLERIKPPTAPADAQPPPAEVVEATVPPPVPPRVAKAPAPASVHVAASPRSDNPSPVYPRHERILGREGTVLVTAVVDRYGVVLFASLAKPSRYAGFNRAALAAVRKWRFTPATVDGAPAQDEVDVPVIFRLEDVK